MRISAARNDTIAMMRVRGTAAGARVCNAALWLCGLGIAAACIPSLQAQDAPPTLHVYTNLVQIPTLVLQADRKPLAAPLAEGRFFVKLPMAARSFARPTRGWRATIRLTCQSCWICGSRSHR